MAVGIPHSCPIRNIAETRAVLNASAASTPAASVRNFPVTRRPEKYDSMPASAKRTIKDWNPEQAAAIRTGPSFRKTKEPS